MTTTSPQSKDQLFLLQPGFFVDGRGPLYCSHSAPVEGLLGFFPALRERIDVHYLAFARPRPPLVDLLGDAHQSAPTLVLAPDAQVPDGIEARESQGHRFIDREADIRRYLSTVYGVAQAS